MDLQRESDSSLLRRLLAAVPSNHAIDDSTLLRSILDAAPRVIRQRRKSTLFEAMHILDLENPHSDFLAWLLDPLGPLIDRWLLKMLAHRVAPDQEMNDEPTVEREVEIQDNGRLDILISWSSFNLVIENKVWSVEGTGQVAKYLKWADQRLPVRTVIIYLTQTGERPPSCPDDESRVVTLSYSELAQLLESGIAQFEQDDNDRGRIFAREFRNNILRLLKVRFDMNKPAMSESTRIYLANAKRFDEIKNNAIEESADLLQWMLSEIDRRLRPLLGELAVVHRGKYVTIFRRPEWREGHVIYGFYFGTEYDMTRRLIADHDYGPWAGIGAWLDDDRINYAACQSVIDRLFPLLQEVWNEKDDLTKACESTALWRTIPVEGDIDRWCDNTIAFFEKLAPVCLSVIERIAIKTI